MRLPKQDVFLGEIRERITNWRKADLFDARKQFLQKEISKFSYLWLNNIRLLYKYYNKNQPIVLYDLVISSAFLLRSVLYFCSYLKSKNEEMKI